MKKRIRKKNQNKMLQKTFKEFCSKEIAKLKYGCDRRDEDIAALREELTAYKQLLHASQINFEWALRKLIGERDTIEIPSAELVPNREVGFVSTKEKDKVIIQKIKLENNSPIFEKNT